MKVDYHFYLCTDSNMIDREILYKKVKQAIFGGVSIIQVREKGRSTREFLDIAKNIQKIAESYDVPLIVNDRVDIALALDADGVHLGQDDMPCSMARKILGTNKIIGVSVRNLQEAKQAEKDGADYLGVGAMFKSKTKPEAKQVSFKALKNICANVQLPIILIGGINKKTIPLFKDFKVSGFAMISHVLKPKNTQKTAKEYNKLITNSLK